MRGLANFISLVFHPIFLYTYLYLLHWWLYPYTGGSMQTAGVLLISFFVFLNTAVVPVALLLARKISLTDQDRQQRQRTIQMVLVLYTFIYFLFPRQFIPEYLLDVLLATVIGLCVAFVVNMRMKISLHGSAWGGFLSVILFLLFQFNGPYFLFFMVSVICAGLVGFSRLYLGAHTNKELYSGYAAGFVSTSIVMFVGQSF